MKLSKRERVLIFIFIIALAVYAGYKFIPTLNLFNLETLKAEYNLKKIEYDNMSQNILLKSKYEENVQALSEEINSLDVISNLQQEQIIVFLNSCFDGSNIDANNISFTDAAVVPMGAAVPEKEAEEKSSLDVIMADINKTQTTEQNAEQISSDNNTKTDADSNEAKSSEKSAQQQDALSARSISATVAFESTYSNMINFIDAIQDNSVDMSITNINTVSAEEGVLQGVITLNFYEIPKPEGFNENNSEWIWKDLAKSGKANPFSTGGAWETIGSLGAKFDFYVNLEPESSDLPTVLIGKTEDSTRSTYISENSNAVENVQFNFKTENSKYYYSYSTKNNAYPKAGAWQEFSPSEDGIMIRIYCAGRNSKTDSVGASIGVTNTSGLKVYFEIENDSSTNPRVTFNEPKSVVVTRK